MSGEVASGRSNGGSLPKAGARPRGVVDPHSHTCLADEEGEFRFTEPTQEPVEHQRRAEPKGILAKGKQQTAPLPV